MRVEPEPLEGTRMDLFNSIIPNWWAANVTGTTLVGTPDLANQVWVANRCQQLNAQQIAAMPLRWHGSAGTLEPRWVSSPDPVLFPNGIGDAMFAIVDQVYGWGYSLQVVTSRYESGYPRTWTVVPSSSCTPKLVWIASKCSCTTAVRGFRSTCRRICSSRFSRRRREDWVWAS